MLDVFKEYLNWSNIMGLNKPVTLTWPVKKDMPPT